MHPIHKYLHIGSVNIYSFGLVGSFVRVGKEGCSCAVYITTNECTLNLAGSWSPSQCHRQCLSLTHFWHSLPASSFFLCCPMRFYLSWRSSSLLCFDLLSTGHFSLVSSHLLQAALSFPDKEMAPALPLTTQSELPKILRLLLPEKFSMQCHFSFLSM